MPKVELHVHLEGSIRPETLLKLAAKNGVDLPAKDLDGLRDWYQFRDFGHFVEIYVAATKCLQSADDIELIARELAISQHAENVLHTEATYTASTLEKHCGIAWPDQLAALRRASRFAKDELGITLQFILDIVRGDPPERGLMVAQWAVEAQGDPVCALGLAGIEMSTTAEVYKEAFDFAHSHGLRVVPHAGETKGPESVWDALEFTRPVRIGHGVRSIEDPKLVAKLAEMQIPLEVCPSSNLCLGVYPSLAEHSLPELLNEGLLVTINSDDPPMFSTSISEEFYRVAQEFRFGKDILWTLVQNAGRSALLPDTEKAILMERLRTGFADLG